MKLVLNLIAPIQIDQAPSRNQISRPVTIWNRTSYCNLQILGAQMNFTQIRLSIFLAAVLVLSFQNCTGNKFTSTVTDSADSSSTGDLSNSSSATSNTLQDNSALDCNRGIYKWKVGNNNCQAGYEGLQSEMNSKVIQDNIVPTTGQITLTCFQGKPVPVTTEGKTCLNHPLTLDVNSRPAALKSYVVPSDYSVFIYTGVLYDNFGNSSGGTRISMCLQKIGSADAKCVAGEKDGSSAAYVHLNNSNVEFYGTGITRGPNGEAVYLWDPFRQTTDSGQSAGVIGEYEAYFKTASPSNNYADNFIGVVKFSVGVPELDIQTKYESTYVVDYAARYGLGYSGLKMSVSYSCRDTFGGNLTNFLYYPYSLGFGPENTERQCGYTIKSLQ